VAAEVGCLIAAVTPIWPRAASRERSAVAERLQDPGGGRPKPGRGRVGGLGQCVPEVRRELWRDSTVRVPFLTPDSPLWPGSPPGR
jgi:hypothetical protein